MSIFYSTLSTPQRAMQLGSRAVVCALATLFMYGTVGAVDLIWLSPTNLNYSSPYYLENYDAEIGVWSTIDVGTGSRGSAPISLMDSKGVIWIMFGSQVRWEESYLYSVWNYNPKTDQYRYVWGSNETAVTMNPRNPGDLRVANGTNHPGYVAFEGATLDKDDNIWFTTYEVSGELWMFNTTSMVFVRMFGLGSETQSPSFGANPGMPAEDVWPGYVEGECLVTDSQNNIWHVTGYNDYGVTNAVWMFNTTSYLWTFIYGDVNQQWITHNATFFGGVWMPGCFIDENDKVWLFGGWGASDNQNHDDYASIWTFDTRDTREYKLEYGENTYGRVPQVVSDDFHADNHPGGCEGPIFVDRKDGTLMAVIGSGYDSNGNYGGTDQIWLYNVTVKQWKLIYGNISAIDGEGAFTHYRQPGSQFPGTTFFGQFSGKNTNGDVYIVNGGPTDGYQLSRKDIWLVPQDQCSFSTANDCDVNAICTEEMFGYSCACKEGYTGNGTTCTAVPVATPTTESSPTAGSTPSKQQTSSASIIGLTFIVACIVISIVF